jgi:hypothetical protein
LVAGVDVINLLIIMQRFGSGWVGDGFIDEVFCESVKMLAQLVFLKQVADGRDRRLIWNPVTE